MQNSALWLTFVYTAEPGYWENHASYILAINASLLFGEEPSAAIIVFDAMYAISALNSSLVKLIHLCWFYCIHWNVQHSSSKNQCRQYISYNMVKLQALTMKCFTCLLTYINHDLFKWKHFPCYWPFVRGIHQAPVHSPHKGQWHGALMLSLICAWMNGWIKYRKARAHYDVTVMTTMILYSWDTSIDFFRWNFSAKHEFQ